MEHLLTQNSQTIFLIKVLSTFERCGAGNLPILLDLAVKMGSNGHIFAGNQVEISHFFAVEM